MRFIKIVFFLFTLITVNLLANTNTPIEAKKYQKMLGVGMDVDWAKSDAGREAIKKARKEGISVPELFKQRGFSHVRIRVKDDVLKDSSLLEEIEYLVDESLRVGLIPIVAYQAKEFKNNPHSDKSLNHVKAWWEKVGKGCKKA